MREISYRVELESELMHAARPSPIYRRRSSVRKSSPVGQITMYLSIYLPGTVDQIDHLDPYLLS